MTTKRSRYAGSRDHQEAFRGIQFPQEQVELVEMVRDNDPTLMVLDLLCTTYQVSQSSDRGWQLLGRYIAANTHLERLSLPPFMSAVSALFNNLTGSSYH